MNLNYGNGFKKALLIPILLIFSCDQFKPVCDYYKDAGRCPVCPVCAECPTEKIGEPKTIKNIETCVEKCIDEANCFFSFSTRVCLKKCSTKCLEKFGCDGEIR